MGMSVYIATLYQYVVDKLNVLPLILSVFDIVILGYILPRLFYKIYKSDTPGSLNAEKKISNFSNYLSYIIMLLFAVALLIRFIITHESYLDIYVSVIIILLFVYTTYIYYFDYKNIEFEVNDITDINKKTKLMYLENKEFGVKELYIGNDTEYEVGKKYILKYNKNSDLFKSNKSVKEKNKK
jgi:hypothetical protein